MPYIIDGNNLAGKLDILFEDGFNEKLISILQKFNNLRKRNIILVFDSLEPMGDKKQIDDQITVVYAPRDSYYKSADDKIVELVKDNIHDKKNVIVVTDDLEIIHQIEEIETNIDIHTIKATDFAKQVEEKNKVVKSDKDLDEKEVDKINDELLELWK